MIKFSNFDNPIGCIKFILYAVFMLVNFLYCSKKQAYSRILLSFTKINKSQSFSAWSSYLIRLQWKFNLCISCFLPIVSKIVTATKKLACFLLQPLAHLTCNIVYTVKNSYDFVNKLKHTSPSNYTLLSLDVKSLLINVPIQRALDYLEKRLCDFLYSSIEIKEILKLVY